MPNLTFFCELEVEALQALFDDPAVIDDLVALEAGVSLGLIDLSPERAAVVRRLNEAGVPVIAWFLLPKEQGYWFNADNAAQAATRYEAFLAWTEEHDLKWAGLGLDIEPDFQEMQKLLTGEGWQLLPQYVGRLFNKQRLRQAQDAYGRLIGRMRDDGYLVESYHFPFIVDERRVGSTLLQRLLGLVEVPADREWLMLYTSFLPGIGPAMLCSYGPDADLIAVGITGGGVDAGLETRSLSWDELSRDLLLARPWSDSIAIFSLEGSVRQGFLSRLKTFDWEQPAQIPTQSVKEVDAVRKGLRGFLWAGTHPLPVLAGLAGLLFLLSRLRRLLKG